MRHFARMLACLLAFAPCAALAELSLVPSAACVAAGNAVDFTLSGQAGESYAYTLYREGEALFTRETGETAVSYLPRETGAYTLMVTAREETAQADFTVTDPLSCTLPQLPQTIAAGEPLLPAPCAAGGLAPYTYVYALSGPDGEKAWAADAAWHWVPARAGAYHLTVIATDALGNQARAEADLTVTDGTGISVLPGGGALLAHGGQKSWMVYAPGAWTATTGDDFLQLDTGEGLSGESLCITVTQATDTPRQGSVTLRSGDAAMVLQVRQSAAQGVDEELSLLPPAEPVLVEGAEHTAWLNADGAKTFAVACAGSWTATAREDFIHIDAAEGSLTLSVDEPQPGTARAGLVTIATGDSAAYVHVYQPAGKVQAGTAEEVPLPETQAEGFTLHSQSCGYWQDKPYGRTNLQQSGCAIFALSHALQCLGFQGEETTPEYLAAHYAASLREGGTVNSYLVGHAADDLGFKTRYDLYDSLPAIREKLQEGAVFSFAVVSGHIAMVAGQSQDGTMFRIIDSAPSATWERIQNARLYMQTADGGFAPMESLRDVPGLRYYIETGCFGGAEYWLEADYVARRGVRLIQLREE